MPLGTSAPCQQGQAYSCLSKVTRPVPALARPNKLLTPARIFLNCSSHLPTKCLVPLPPALRREEHCVSQHPSPQSSSILPVPGAWRKVCTTSTSVKQVIQLLLLRLCATTDSPLCLLHIVHVMLVAGCTMDLHQDMPTGWRYTPLTTRISPPFEIPFGFFSAGLDC